MKICVTGCAGFIGFHLCQKLLHRGDQVIGIDNLNAYYDPMLKQARLKILNTNSRFNFIKTDIIDRLALERVFEEQEFTHVVHLAAQAGVRYSLTNPHAYIDSNLVGFGNILENCRQAKIKNLVFASSSSVYGANENYPFHENYCTDHPVALYGATKKANEIMAHSYAYLYQLPCTGLRFFTAYGPWGRPDMALFLFTKNMMAGLPIDVFNEGKMARDFTYIDDIVEGVIRTIDNPAIADLKWESQCPNSSTSSAPYRIYNIGCGNPVRLLDFIEILESELKIKAIKNWLPMQPGDVCKTFANTENLARELNYSPKISVQEGVRRFLQWYKAYYQGVEKCVD